MAAVEHTGGMEMFLSVWSCLCGVIARRYTIISVKAKVIQRFLPLQIFNKTKPSMAMEFSTLKVVWTELQKRRKKLHCKVPTSVWVVCAALTGKL